MFRGREKIKNLNICIESDVINSGFLSRKKKKKWLGTYNKKKGPGSVIIVSLCLIVQKLLQAETRSLLVCLDFLNHWMLTCSGFSDLWQLTKGTG